MATTKQAQAARRNIARARGAVASKRAIARKTGEK
jgi:hypothetical protein